MTLLSPEVRAEIGDLNARFAWALDVHDFEALRGLFTAELHYVSVGREFFGIDELIASFAARTGTRTTRHGLGNLLLEDAGDGTATGRSSWHTFASNQAEPTGVPLFMVADFADRYAPTDAGWRITERIITPVFRDAALAPGAPTRPLSGSTV